MSLSIPHSMPRRPAGQSATLSRHSPSPHQPYLKNHPVSSTPTKSLSRTSSRGYLHRSSRTRSDMPDRPPPDNSSPHPSTPTPHKGGRRRRPNGKPPSARLREGKAVSDVEHGGEHDPSSEDDEILFDLLGVPTPAKANTPVPGLLPISKAQLSKSGKSKAERDGQVRGTDQPSLAQGGVNGTNRVTRINGRGKRQPRGSMSESEMLSSTRKPKPNKKVDRIQTADPNISSFPSNHDLSTLSASRPKKSQPISQRIEPALSEPITSLDLSSLSQSLPSERGLQAPPPGSTKKGKGKKDRDLGAENDESAVWEMPDLPPPSTSQSMTWQQKLQSSEPGETPRRNKSHTSSRSVNLLSEQKPRSRPATSHPANTPNPQTSSPLVTRPTQTRRMSLDASSNSVPLSAFDHTIPYHTGYNVNRAPQTPMKLATSQNAAANLPLQQGEYPRLKHGSKGPLGGLVQSSSGGGDSGKYAGPTFHNSPHAASLPKPDMDDF